MFFEKLSFYKFSVLVIVITTISFSKIVIKKTDGTTVNIDIMQKDIRSIEIINEKTVLDADKIIFKDNFSNTNLINWTGDAPKKVISRSAYVSSGNNNKFMLKKKIPVENVVIEWRGAASDNGFYVTMGPYSVSIGSYNNTCCTYSGPGVKHKIIETGRVFVEDKTYRYRIERIGSELNAYQNDKILFSAEIKGKSKTEENLLWFSTWYATLQFDWIKIYKL